MASRPLKVLENMKEQNQHGAFKKINLVSNSKDDFGGRRKSESSDYSGGCYNTLNSFPSGTGIEKPDLRTIAKVGAA